MRSASANVPRLFAWWALAGAMVAGLAGCGGQRLDPAQTVLRGALTLADLPGFWTATGPLVSDNAAQLEAGRTAPGCQPVSLRRDIRASASESFSLSLTPDGRAAAGVNETVTFHASPKIAAAAQDGSAAPSYVGCRQGDVESRIRTELSPGESPLLRRGGPTRLVLPSGVIAARFTDTATAPGCTASCPPLQYDLFSIRARGARAVIDIDFTSLPGEDEVLIVSNAQARLAAAVGISHRPTETTFLHPTVLNSPQAGRFVQGRTVAGGASGPVPWKPFDALNSALAVTPNGIALRVFGSFHQGIGSLLPALANLKIDVDVKADGPSAISAVGCRWADGNYDFEFGIEDLGRWMILQFQAGLFKQILAQGVAVAINPTATPNHLTVACSSPPSGRDDLTFAVNGTIVAHTRVPVGPEPWTPAVYLNGVLGSATASFTNFTASTW